MNKLQELDVKQALPDSIAGDENVQVLAEMLTAEFIQLADMSNLLLMLPNVSKQSDDVLDQLAWHLHVDFYNQDAPREEREALIYQSIAWHGRKGTPSAVEDMVKTIYATAEVDEWYQYNGEPYHFRVNVYGDAVTDAEKLKKMETSVEAVKNVRSFFDGFNFINVVNSITYVGSIPGYDNTRIVVK